MDKAGAVAEEVLGKRSGTTLDGALKAIANPVRRSMVMVLLDAPGGLVTNCTVFNAPVSKSTLTQHLHVLDAAGIVETTDHGNRCSVRLRSAELDTEVPGLLEFLRVSAVTSTH